MKRALLLAALVGATLVPTPASAQRNACGFGLGLAALRAADKALKQGVAASSLSAGRGHAATAGARLAEAAQRLGGCGCALAAAALQDAGQVTEQAQAEAMLATLQRRLDRAGLSLDQAQARLDRQGCS